MAGKMIDIAEMRRQSRPRPKRLVTRIPMTTCSWKKKPRVPRTEGSDISPWCIPKRLVSWNLERERQSITYVTRCHHRADTTRNTAEKAPNIEHAWIIRESDCKNSFASLGMTVTRMNGKDDKKPRNRVRHRKHEQHFLAAKQVH